MRVSGVALREATPGMGRPRACGSCSSGCAGLATELVRTALKHGNDDRRVARFPHESAKTCSGSPTRLRCGETFCGCIGCGGDRTTFPPEDRFALLLALSTVHVMGHEEVGELPTPHSRASRESHDSGSSLPTGIAVMSQLHNVQAQVVEIHAGAARYTAPFTGLLAPDPSNISVDTNCTNWNRVNLTFAQRPMTMPTPDLMVLPPYTVSPGCRGMTGATLCNTDTDVTLVRPHLSLVEP